MPYLGMCNQKSGAGFRVICLCSCHQTYPNTRSVNPSYNERARLNPQNYKRNSFLPFASFLSLSFCHSVALSPHLSMPTLTSTQKFPDKLRTVFATHEPIRHPLNVCPLGNLLLCDPPEGLLKDQQLGDFARFPEELLMAVLGHVDDHNALKALSYTSRVFYAYCYDEDLWKQLYIRNVVAQERDGKPAPEPRWRGTWRLTMLGVDLKMQADVRLPNTLVCSDVLFRPFQCSQVNYDRLFQKVIREEETYHMHVLASGQRLDSELPRGRIARFPESYLSLHIFNSYLHNRPFILCNAEKDRWPRWNIQSLLARFADVKFRQEAVQWPLSLFSQYLRSNRDESPLYLFDCKSEAMKTLCKEYNAPSIFQLDLFTVFGECRPDHAWLIIGSQRSGSTFHKDPNNTSAWNTVLSGRKLWVMFPPGVTPPGVSTDEEESEVTSPVGLAEWVLSGFYNDSVKHPDVQIGITFPGECMYVPSGWWHAVINLEESVALTQNFVLEAKLGSVLHFLKNRRKQVSGFLPARVRAALKNVLSKSTGEDDVYDAFHRFCDAYDKRAVEHQLHNENFGEISECQLPTMPVYELFTELLKMDGKSALLDEALVELRRRENSEQRLTSGKSEAWTELSTSLSFAFGFDLDEE